MTRSDDLEVLKATADLVRRSWSMLDDAAPRPPFRSDQLTELLVRTRTRVCEYPFASGAVGMAIPWGGDEHAILIDSAASRADYQFTIRHELAHVLAGEVSDALFLSAADTMSLSERRADLFAVTDLVPAWLMRQLSHRRPQLHVRSEVQLAFRELTSGWSPERLSDRTRLRILLHKQTGL